jgi:probable HAF family extracellular repeat protein
MEGDMLRICGRCAVAVLCLATAGTTGAAAGRSLAFVTIDFPGAILTNAQGINAEGEIVGGYTDTAGRQHGFLLSGDQFQSIDVPNSRATFARGIGPNGDVVGSYVAQVETTNVPAHGFLLNNRGEFRAVDFPGHINTIPQRILPDGTILGCYHDTDTMGTMHGMSYSRGGWDAIPEGMSMHNGATPNGKLIVGLFTDMDNRGKGYFLDRGRFIPFEVPGAIQTSPWDMNPAGVTVGVYRDAAGKFHGFQYDGESFGSVDVPAATATRVFGINSHGDLVGAYVDAGGRTHGFLAQWVDNP